MTKNVTRDLSHLGVEEGTAISIRTWEGTVKILKSLKFKKALERR